MPGGNGSHAALLSAPSLAAGEVSTSRDLPAAFHSFSGTAGATVLLAGAGVLAGWIFDVPALKSVAPGLVTMKANTALGLILAGVALQILRVEDLPRGARRAGQAGALLAAAIGLATLCEYAFGWDLGIDQALFEEPPETAGTSHPGRMAPTSAANFVLLGAALFSLGARSSPWRVEVPTLLAVVVSLMAYFGYVYDLELFYRATSMTGMAIHSAAAFLVLGAGVLCARPNGGIMSIITSEDAGGGMARRLLPVTIITPMMLGWLNWEGRRAGYFTTVVGLALLTVANVLVFNAVVLWNARVLHRVDRSRRRAERALAERAEELARSNRDLEQFAYVASHDLQEPLRMVSSYVQLLERRYKEGLDDRAREFIRYAVDGARRMQALIQDLLAYSRVGRVRKPFEPTSCDAVLDRALSNLQVAIEECGATVSREPLPTVTADQGELLQLFQNLLSNAIKFRRPGAAPHVAITAARHGGEWRISLRDEGIGIDPRFAERIFVIFQRLHTRDEYSGTGIGLAICKKIVERHGGRIWVESLPSRGATFTFTIPERGGRAP